MLCFICDDGTGISPASIAYTYPYKIANVYIPAVLGCVFVSLLCIHKLLEIIVI